MGFKKISIIVPCYNESRTIVEILDKVYEADTLGLEKEIIIVDDGSKDGTRKILGKYKKKNGFKIIFHKNNTGKGGALKTGFLQSTGDLVIVQDADLEYDPNEYVLLIKPMIKGNYDVVYGSRYLDNKPHRALYFWHSLVNKSLTAFSNLLTGLKLTDMETCYKMFRGEIIRELAPNLESKRFGFEPEITAKLAHRKNIKFFEVGISYNGRDYKGGKHIDWKDGVKAVLEIIKYNVFKK
jgi:glycosyltransferase involved in cell wall biosynthesis